MLTGKQKRYLRAKANRIKPIFQVGKIGVNANMIVQIKEALEKRELIKVSILQNCIEDKESIADQIADGAEAHIVQIIGNNIVLFKQSEKNPQIDLP